MNFELLKDKNFLLLIIGRFTSMVGATLLSFALSLYVLSTTGSSAKFASVFALSGLTSLVLTPVSGVFADWFDRKKIMVVVDFISAFVILGFFLFSMIDKLEVSHVYLIVIVLAALSAIDTPAVQSSIPSLVSGEKIVYANSLNVSIQTLAQIIAPIAGGIIFYAVSIKGILLITSITFLLTAVLEIFMHIPSNKKIMKKKWYVEFTTDFKEGLRYVYHHKTIRWIIIVAIFANVISPIITVGFPYVINIDLALSTAQYGTFQALFIFGILIGSIVSAKLATKLNLIKLLSIVMIVFGVLVAVIGFIILPDIFNGINNVSIIFVIMCATNLSIGVVLTIFNIAVQTAVQKETPNHLIGRVFGVIVTLSMSLSPIGQLLYGLMFDSMSSSAIILVSAVILSVVGAVSAILYLKEQKKSLKVRSVINKC